MPCHPDTTCQVGRQLVPTSQDNFALHYRLPQRLICFATCGLFDTARVLPERVTENHVQKTFSAAAQATRPQVRGQASTTTFEQFYANTKMQRVWQCALPMSSLLQTDLPCSVRGAHTISFGKGVNYFPSLSKHGRPASISQVDNSTSSQ